MFGKDTLYRSLYIFSHCQNNKNRIHVVFEIPLTVNVGKINRTVIL